MRSTGFYYGKEGFVDHLKEEERREQAALHKQSLSTKSLNSAERIVNLNELGQVADTSQKVQNATESKKN